MLIAKSVVKAFNDAVENVENKNTDGSMNWNYVEADVFLDCPKFSGDYLYNAVNTLADESGLA